MSITIGITIANDTPLANSLFSNGISQNILFLHDLLTTVGYNCLLVTYKPEDNQSVELGGKNYTAYTLQEVLDNNIHLDACLEIGMSLRNNNRQVIREHMGTRIAAISYGHVMIHDMEQIIYSHGIESEIRHGKVDRVWASPHFASTFSYLSTLFHAPVRMAPYIWEPRFIHGQPFTAADHQAQPTIRIMESNLSIMKNSIIPLTIVESICRTQPDIFSKCFVNNAKSWSENTYFLKNMLKNMPWLGSRAQKVEFGPRNSFAQNFAKRDILLSHQMMCELNYLYLEALHLNVPLVHNSPRLKDVGYYYEDCDIDQGREAVTNAIKDQNIEANAIRGREFVKQFSINNPLNQLGYKELIEELMAH
ncbi:MAG: DUF2827 family protein [Pseudomonadales bacterium]